MQLQPSLRSPPTNAATASFASNALIPATHQHSITSKCLERPGNSLYELLSVSKAGFSQMSVKLGNKQKASWWHGVGLEGGRWVCVCGGGGGVGGGGRA